MRVFHVYGDTLIGFVTRLHDKVQPRLCFDGNEEVFDWHLDKIEGHFLVWLSQDHGRENRLTSQEQQ